MSLRHDLRVIRAVAATDIRLTLREPLFAIIGVLIPINFLLLFLLFAISGGQAPIAVVMNDHGPLAQRFVQAMDGSHSFIIHTATPTAIAASPSSRPPGSPQARPWTAKA